MSFRQCHSIDYLDLDISGDKVNPSFAGGLLDIMFGDEVVSYYFPE